VYYHAGGSVLGLPFHFFSGTVPVLFFSGPPWMSPSFPQGMGEGVSYWILVAKAKLEASLILNRSEPCPLKQFEVHCKEAAVNVIPFNLLGLLQAY
jgi:hypothetical protein